MEGLELNRINTSLKVLAMASFAICLTTGKSHAQSPTEHKSSVGIRTFAKIQPVQACTCPGEASLQYGISKLQLDNAHLPVRFDLHTPKIGCINLSHFGKRDLSTAWLWLQRTVLPEQANGLSAAATPLSPFMLLPVQAKTSSSQRKPSPFLKWLGVGAFWWAAFFDHYQDAIQDNGGKPTHLFGADNRHWHFIKNLAHLGYLTAGFAAGMELAQKKVGVKQFVLRAAGAVMIYWFIQNIVYDKAQNDVWFDYDRKYKTDGIVIFDLTGKDHRIELSKWSRPLLDVIRVFGGMYLAVKN